MSGHGQCTDREEKLNSANVMHVGELQSLCQKNTLKQGKFLKLTAKPKVVENLKRSWKKSWKVMEFEELKRV